MEKNRDGWVEINLDALEHNVKEIKNFLNKNVSNPPDVLAVIKADGYGHGSVMCAPTLCACGVNYFGVATIDEGIELRENKISTPVLVLGASPLLAFENAIKNDIELSIFNDLHLEAAELAYKKLNKKLKAHIKLDTGMNRIGINHDDAPEFINKVLNNPYIDLKGIFTHFADIEDNKLFNKQMNKFMDIIEQYKNDFETRQVKIHCLNSGGIFSYPNCSNSMVRMGIIMWGLTPYCDNKKYIDTMPVMSLKARISNIHILKKGDGISYGHTYIAEKDIKVATLPIGYADGLDRGLSGKITASLNGKIVNQIGRITMDQVMFDVSDVECNVGDVAVLIGKENTVDNIDTWAEKLNTINYELTCRMKMRLPRIYTR